MSIVLHNGRIAGARYKTAISHDGAAVVSHGGLRPTSDREWNMIWDGHHFAPPSSGAVLYLQGLEGTGSTIYDYSWNFGDSGINTDEGLDDSETGVDCDADATTACPVGSVIQIDSEYMWVTATGTTLTVIRGYKSAVVAHDTAADVYVWIPKNGTITGATWRRLPSGLGYPALDGSDDGIRLAKDTFSEATFAAGITLKAWIILSSVDATEQAIIDIEGRLRLSVKGTTDKLNFLIYDGASHNIAGNDALVVGTPYHVVATWDTTTMRTYVDAVVQTATIGSNVGTIDGTSEPTSIGLVEYGVGPTRESFLHGGIPLVEIYNRAWSAPEVTNSRNQERHLLGV